MMDWQQLTQWSIVTISYIKEQGRSNEVNATILPFDEAVDSRTVIVIVFGSDGQAETIFGANQRNR